MRSDLSSWRLINLRQLLSVHCWSHLPHSTNEQINEWHQMWSQPEFWSSVVLLAPHRRWHPISTWSSESHEGLTICRFYSKIIVLIYFNTASVGWAGIRTFMYSGHFFLHPVCATMFDHSHCLTIPLWVPVSCSHAVKFVFTSDASINAKTDSPQAQVYTRSVSMVMLMILMCTSSLRSGVLKLYLMRTGWPSCLQRQNGRT